VPRGGAAAAARWQEGGKITSRVRDLPLRVHLTGHEPPSIEKSKLTVFLQLTLCSLQISLINAKPSEIPSGFCNREDLHLSLGTPSKHPRWRCSDRHHRGSRSRKDCQSRRPLTRRRTCERMCGSQPRILDFDCAIFSGIRQLELRRSHGPGVLCATLCAQSTTEHKMNKPSQKWTRHSRMLHTTLHGRWN
jgi:hypothetical protein